MLSLSSRLPPRLLLLMLPTHTKLVNLPLLSKSAVPAPALGLEAVAPPPVEALALVVRVGVEDISVLREDLGVTVVELPGEEGRVEGFTQHGEEQPRPAPRLLAQTKITICSHNAMHKKW